MLLISLEITLLMYFVHSTTSFRKVWIEYIVSLSIPNGHKGNPGRSVYLEW